MKHILSCLLAMTAMSASAQTQLIGIRGGIMSTNVTGTVSGHVPEMKTGFSGGLSYEYRTKGLFQFGADLLYQRRGFTTTLAFSIPQQPVFVAVPARFDHNYIALPLKAGVHFGKKISGFANLGVMPALRINGNLSWEAQSYIGGVYPAESNKRIDARVFDLAGLAELGAGYSITPRIQLSVSAGLQYSFTHYNQYNYLDENNNHYGISGSAGIKYILRQ